MIISFETSGNYSENDTASQSGRPPSPNYSANDTASQSGRLPSPKYSANDTASQSGRPPSPNYSANDTASQSGRPPSPNQAIARSFKGRSTRPRQPHRLLYTAVAEPHSKAGCSLTAEMRSSVSYCSSVQFAPFTVTNTG